MLEALRPPLTLVLAGAIWALCHPYAGLVGDATMYIGRVLADRDPAGIGRDIAFAHDGQSRFSLFPTLVTPLVVALGASRAALIVAVSGSACFVAALFAFARSLATGRVALAVMLAVAVLPVGFGDAGVFGFGETMAIPRPFAEAAVLGALAAMLRGRPVLCAGLLALACALHPILGLAGVGVAVLVGLAAAGPGRRLVVIAATMIAAGLAVGLGLAGVPLLDRLVARMDPEWFGIVSTRSPYLFPTRWDASALSPIVAQAATILIAAHLHAGARRAVLVAVAASGLAQLLAAVLLADGLHVLLAVQIQLWRATWLIAVVGGASLVLCADGLWREGPKGRSILALLMFAWFVQPSPVLTAAVAIGALALRSERIGAGLGHRHAVAVAIGVGVLVVAWAIGPIEGYLAFLRAMPAGAPRSLLDPLRNDLQTVPAVLAIGVWLLSRWRPSRAVGGVILACLAFGATALAAMAWDQRTPFRIGLETRHHPDGLAPLLAGRPDEVLWLGALAEPWTMLGLRQYLSPQQEVGIVFSRPLAIEWRRRADVLVGLGLAPKAIYTPWLAPAEGDRAVVTAATLAALCAMPDAPGLVVVPIDGEAPTLDRPGGIVWHPSSLGWVLGDRGTKEWREIRGWTALPCAPPRPISPLASSPTKS